MIIPPLCHNPAHPPSFPELEGIALKITGRLMGLILAAIAVQFILNGVLAARLFS
jgi:hypothetical protein